MTVCSYIKHKVHQDVLDRFFLDHFFVSATLRRAECGARNAVACIFKIGSFLAFELFFDFVLCDVGHFAFTQSHSVDISCWSALMILLCLALFSDLSSAVIV